MNPYLTIWTKPRPTIDYVTSRRWPWWQQLIPFALLGINGVATDDIMQFFGIENFFAQLLFILISGTIVGAIVMWIWTNAAFFSGRFFKGKASILDVQHVFALSCIPELIITVHWITIALISADHTIQRNLYSPVYLICNIIGWRILIIGLARTQKFSYGTAVVSLLIVFLVMYILFGSLTKH